MRGGPLKVLALGALCQVVCYAIQSPAPPFPAMVLANAVGGFGIALQVRPSVHLPETVFAEISDCLERPGQRIRG